MDVRDHNRQAWDREVDAKNRWTVPVSSSEIARARQDDWSVLLTPTSQVPRSWFPKELFGVSILCLASGGGQQGPILAAAGANVTVFENSPKQQNQDRMVAKREGLKIRTVEGDMVDLSTFEDESFDLVFHPCSNCFIPDVRSVWQETFRVLRRGGRLLAGMTNPVRYLFDEELEENGQLVVRHRIPYSDLTSVTEREREKFLQTRPLEFGHTLDDLIGGQTDAGFVVAGFYEDRYDDTENDQLSQFMATFIATCALKPT